MPKLLTIGVYGFTPDTFFNALVQARTDLFCDLRFQRGMRGTRYTFANSKRLQYNLAQRGIRYLHLKDLAPARWLRNLQAQEDAAAGATGRTRTALSHIFIEQYEQLYLSPLHAESFLQRLGPNVNVIALFCVERHPEACHRSLLAAQLARDLDLEVEHIVPAAHMIV